MGFDRNAAGGGVELECTLENGKALLTWRFHFTEFFKDVLVRLTMTDKEGNVVLVCLRREPEEEPLQSILLRPRLWNGVGDPYLYQAEICLLEGGRLLDRLNISVPLRSLRQIPGKGFYLNDGIFEPRTVNYSLPPAVSAAGMQDQILKDIQLLHELGANSIFCVAKDREIKGFRQLCDRFGLLLWSEMGEVNFRAENRSLLDPHTDRPASLFYHCKARWSRQPFVYIAPESVRPLPSGNYRAVVYSSCDRVALYTDGILFEFQSGEEEFVFEEIPVRHPCVILTAEAEECCMAFSVHRTSKL